jgi:hypothetical protein
MSAWQPHGINGNTLAHTVRRRSPCCRGRGSPAHVLYAAVDVPLALLTSAACTLLRSSATSSLC